MEELHARAKRVEDRSHLGARRAAANDNHRGGDGVQAPSIAMRIGELEAGNVQPPTDAARAEDKFLGLEPLPGCRFDCLWVNESHKTSAFVHRDPERIDLLAPGRVCTHVLNDLADTRE